MNATDAAEQSFATVRDAVVEVRRFQYQTLPLELTEPFGIAGGSHDAAPIVVVRVQLADGTWGLGEAAPLPAYNGDTIAGTLRALGLALNLLSSGPRTLGAWASSLRAVSDVSPAARCAVEMAICDGLARSRGQSLYRFFGGQGSGRLSSDVTIPITTPAQAQEAAARWRKLGFSQLKLKVGLPGDFERLCAVKAGAPDAELLLDANAGLSGAEALRLLKALEGERISVALFEQPVAKDDWRGLRAVAERCRVALDESVVTPADAERAARELGAPHVVNLKLMKSGVVGVLEIAALARREGLGLMVGGMVESTLAMTTSACLAAGLGGVEFVDLDTPLFIRDCPFSGGMTRDGSALSVAAIDLGHGVDWPGAVWA